LSFAEAEADRQASDRQFARRIADATSSYERAQILSEKHAKVDTGTAKQVGIGGIAYDARLRALNKSTVRDLAKSLAKIGMLNPITLKTRPRGGYELVCGAHRFEAAKLLGWGTVPVIVIDGPADDFELAQIDENLCREGLTAIERAFHIARSKELYEGRHPDATAKAIQSRHAREINGKEASAGAVSCKPYRHAAAADLGVSPVAIDETVRFSKIPNVQLAVGTSLDSAPQLRALHKLRKSDPGKVQALLSRAASGEKVSAIEPTTAAEEFAAWLAKRAKAAEISTIIVWLRKVSAKGVGVALRRISQQA
jgi:hypothetical protein